MSKSYVISDYGLPPRLANGGEWYVLRLALGLIGKSACEHEMPEGTLTAVVPPFTMVATDRESAKEAIAAKIDAIFDAIEYDEEQEKKCQ